MRKGTLLNLSTLSLFLLGACESGSAPSDPGPTGPIPYSRVQGIFSARCAGSGCHIDSTNPPILGGSLDLSPSQAGPCTLNVAADQSPAQQRVVPGSPDTSYLLCKQEPLPPSVEEFLALGARGTGGEYAAASRASSSLAEPACCQPVARAPGRTPRIRPS